MRTIESFLRFFRVIMEKGVENVSKLGAWIICGSARLSKDRKTVVFEVRFPNGQRWCIAEVGELLELIAGHRNKVDLHTKIVPKLMLRG